MGIHRDHWMKAQTASLAIVTQGRRVLDRQDVTPLTSPAVRARAVAIISSGLTLIKRWERHPCLRRSKNLKATKQPIDTGTAAGKCFLDMLGVFAESKPTCAKNGRWRASRRPRLLASTRGARFRSIRLRCNS
jgi:hypothetical protein